MLYRLIFNKLQWPLSELLIDSDVPIGLNRPWLYTYIIALFIIVWYLVRVHRKMRKTGETTSPMHFRELAFITTALTLLILPATIVSINELSDFPAEPAEDWDDFGRMYLLLDYIDIIVGFLIYLMIALFSWWAFSLRSKGAPVRLAKGRVMALTMIALVMVITTVIYSFGWLRFHQMYGYKQEGHWFSDVAGAYWFYLFVIILCIVLFWMLITWNRMHTERIKMSRGQLQELAVISIGLLLLLFPAFIDVSEDFIDRYVLNEPYTPDSDVSRAIATENFYVRMSYLFGFCAYLIIGLLALKGFKRASPKVETQKPMVLTPNELHPGD